MCREKDINKLFDSMTDYFQGDKKRIFHFTKVFTLAGMIGGLEQLDENELFILRTAALVHDIGIKPSEKKYGSCTGKQQELEGPPVAEKMLTNLDFPSEVISRVSYLVAHHHTYNNIDGLDYQILVEADLIVNMEEDGLSSEAIKSCIDKVFKTESGTRLCKNIFLAHC